MSGETMHASHPMNRSHGSPCPDRRNARHRRTATDRVRNFFTARSHHSQIRFSDGGQTAIVLVVGILTIMTLASGVFVASTTQSFPIVQNNMAQHDAYRAIQAGLDEYMYLINTDPSRIQCNSKTTTNPSCQTMTNFAFKTWVPVPNTGTNGAPTEWFDMEDPCVNCTPLTVDLTINGAARAGTGVQLETASIDIKQSNNFLTNAWWSVHTILDPSVQTGTGARQSCQNSTNPQGGKGVDSPTGTFNLIWGTGANGVYPYSAACLGGTSLLYNPPGTVFDGPIFSDDPLMVCSFGSPGTTSVGTAAPYLPINTADPNAVYSTLNCPYATLAPNYNVAKTVFPQPFQVPPNNITVANSLGGVAMQDGCDYQGPTQITFEGTNGFKVNSPQTPTSTGTPNVGTDTLNSAKDASTCFPSTAGGDIPLPANQVIFVGNVPGCVVKKNPLQSGFYGTAVFANCEGNALVGNSYYDINNYQNNVGLSGELTIGAENNTVIMNGITYQNCKASVPGDSATSCPLQTGPGAVNDVLGLIGAAFVELNHPTTHSRANPTPVCNGWGSGDNPDEPAATFTANNNGLCDLAQGANNDIRVDAVVLALQDSFAVNDFTNGPQLGIINIDGVIAEYFADVDGAATSGQSGNTTNTGYTAVNYHWDSRLDFIAPPYYLTPGTPAWVIGSFSYSPGQCSPSCPAAPY
jgi:hypothetical protein